MQNIPENSTAKIIARWIRRTIFAIAVLIIVPLAILNRHTITLRISPLDGGQYEMPLFLLLMLAFLLGSFAGFMLAYMRR